MSTQLIIADDEYFIRQKTKRLIPYKDLDIELAGECENGLEVIDLLTKHKIDIILLDIRMPKLSGIEVAQYVFENDLDVKIIILSGYSDFEYARSTFRYGVFDYLLKPVDPDALTEVLKTCLQKLQHEKNQKQQLTKFYHYKKCMNLAGVLRGNIDINTLQNQYPELKNMEYSLFVAIYTVMECEETAKNLISVYRKQEIMCEYFIESEHIFYIQFFLLDNSHELLCHSLCKRYFTETKADCFFIFSKPFSMTDKWLKYQKEALDLLGFRYFTNISDLACATSNEQLKLIIPDISTIRQSLMLILNAIDISGFKNYIEQLFQMIEEGKSYHLLNLVVRELLHTLSIRFPQSNLSGYKQHDYINSIIAEEYLLHELKNTIQSYGLQYMNDSKAIPSDLKIIKKITAYIQEHYAESDLTVTKIADILQLNISYMGSVFKKNNNESILQHLTYVRMEASKKLLLTEKYKTAEIAEMVGFSDVFYYSKRFKKMYGYTPKEYTALQK
jgi:YesN/AraC family two-component response regulator